MADETNVGIICTLMAKDEASVPALKAALRAHFARQMAGEPGARRAAVLGPSPEAPTTVKLVEQWGVAADYEKHKQMPYMAILGADLGPLLGGPPQVEYFGDIEHFDPKPAKA